MLREKEEYTTKYSRKEQQAIPIQQILHHKVPRPPFYVNYSHGSYIGGLG
jgi:hypothetical protein